MPIYAFIPLAILAVLLFLVLILAVLARLKGGRYLRPIAMLLAKVPFMKKAFAKAAIANAERTNPELASAMRKMQTMGEPTSPEQVQRALRVLTPSERKAYMGLAEEQAGESGGFEPTNRQQRRRMEHGGAGMPQRPTATSQRPGAAGRRDKKKK